MLKIIRKSESGEDGAINVNCCDTAHKTTVVILSRRVTGDASTLRTQAAFFLLTRSWVDAHLSARLLNTPCPFIARRKTQRARRWEPEPPALFEGACVYLHLARTGVPSLRYHLRSFSLGENWGLIKFPIILTVQLNARRDGGFDFYFYKPSRKAFVFPFNVGMNDGRALLIPGRASELEGTPSPGRCITQRGDEDSPLSPRAGRGGQTDLLQSHGLRPLPASERDLGFLVVCMFH